MDRFKANGRSVKASKLVDAIEMAVFCGQIEEPTIDDIKGWSEKTWGIFAQIADLKKSPSAETIEIVAHRYEARTQDPVAFQESR